MVIRQTTSARTGYFFPTFHISSAQIPGCLLALVTHVDLSDRGRQSRERHTLRGNTMRTLWRFVREDDGQDLIEYALLAGFISLVAVLAIQSVGTGVNTVYGDIDTAVGNITPLP